MAKEYAYKSFTYPVTVKVESYVGVIEIEQEGEIVLLDWEQIPLFIKTLKAAMAAAKSEAEGEI